jgi:hypothetical protein
MSLRILQFNKQYLHSESTSTNERSNHHRLSKLSMARLSAAKKVIEQDQAP